jgi:hypothetical protein
MMYAHAFKPCEFCVIWLQRMAQVVCDLLELTEAEKQEVAHLLAFLNFLFNVFDSGQC